MQKPRSDRWWQRDTRPDVVEFRHWSCEAHKNYWMTCAQYDGLLERSRGRCEICYRLHLENSCFVPHIDHDHDLGPWAVRGLLCARCNTSLDKATLACKERDAYLAQSWYLAELARLGLPLATPVEPPVGSVVVDVAYRRRIRRADGWYSDGGNRWHNRNQPWTWAEWASEVGPHNLFAAPEGAAI